MSSAAYGGGVPAGGAPAPARRQGPSRGLWAVVGCVGAAVLAIVLAGVIGIAALIAKRDELSPRATEQIAFEQATFEAPKNWQDLEAPTGGPLEYVYDRQEPGGGPAIIVAVPSEPVDPGLLCDSYSDSLAEDGAQVAEASGADFDGEGSASFTADVEDGASSYSSEYHCVSHEDTTVLVIFHDARSPARSAAGEAMIESWSWR